jgi:hypothetical protein
LVGWVGTECANCMTSSLKRHDRKTHDIIIKTPWAEEVSHKLLQWTWSSISEEVLQRKLERDLKDCQNILSAYKAMKYTTSIYWINLSLELVLMNTTVFINKFLNWVNFLDIDSWRKIQ